MVVDSNPRARNPCSAMRTLQYVIAWDDPRKKAGRRTLNIWMYSMAFCLPDCLFCPSDLCLQPIARTGLCRSEPRG